MATAALISLEEYLNTSYEPDCGFVDGLLEEGSGAEWQHSRLHAVLGGYVRDRERKWSFRVAMSLSIRVSPSRVRIPDLCVIAEGDVPNGILTQPPLVCIEILSPGDRWARVEKRIEDFLALGVPHVWVFDPQERQVWDCMSTGRRLVTEQTLEAPPVSIHLLELFAELD